MSDLDDSIKTNFEHDKFRMMANIVFTSNWIQKNASDVLEPYGISSPQFNILRILRGAKVPLAMSEVKNRMIEKSPHTTRLTTKLLDKGLIQRRRSDKDRRIVFVEISKEGLALLKELDEPISEVASYLGNITMEEAIQVNSILDKLRQ